MMITYKIPCNEIYLSSKGLWPLRKCYNNYPVNVKSQQRYKCMSLCHYCDWINFNKTSPADIKPSRRKPSVTDTASQHALLSLLVCLDRQNEFFTSLHPFIATAMEFHSKHGKILCPRALRFFSSWISQISQLQKLYQTANTKFQQSLM